MCETVDHPLRWAIATPLTRPPENTPNTVFNRQETAEPDPSEKSVDDPLRFSSLVSKRKLDCLARAMVPVDLRRSRLRGQDHHSGM